MAFYEVLTDISDWREGTVTDHAYKVVGGFEAFSDFDAYSYKLGREMVALYRFGDVTKASEISDDHIVTTGDVRRFGPHTEQPPTVEGLFASSGLDSGFDLRDLRAVNYSYMASRPQRKTLHDPASVNSMYVDQFQFFALANLVPRRRTRSVGVGAVGFSLKINFPHPVIRTVQRSVEVGASLRDMHPRSVEPIKHPI
jgi:hypothetical protein